MTASKLVGRTGSAAASARVGSRPPAARPRPPRSGPRSGRRRPPGATPGPAGGQAAHLPFAAADVEHPAGPGQVLGGQREDLLLVLGVGPVGEASCHQAVLTSHSAADSSARAARSEAAQPSPPLSLSASIDAAPVTDAGTVPRHHPGHPIARADQRRRHQRRSGRHRPPAQPASRRGRPTAPPGRGSSRRPRRPPGRAARAGPRGPRGSRPSPLDPAQLLDQALLAGRAETRRCRRAPTRSSACPGACGGR